MKTLNTKTKMTKLMFGFLTALVMMTTACSKSSNSPAPAPAPVYPVGCTSNPCNPGGITGGQLLYSGQTQGSTYVNAQFQVYGNQSGDGAGSVSGVVQFSNWLCANGGNLAGQYQLTAQGNLIGGQYNGYGQMTSSQVYLQIDPGTTSGPGLFSITVPNCLQMDGSATRFDVNF
jgi:hypothetical protein